MKCRQFFGLLLILPISFIYGGSDFQNQSTLWLGVTDLPGFKVHVEAHFESQKDNIVGGSISFFAETVRSYDVILFPKQQLEQISNQADSISFSFYYSGTIIQFQGTKTGGIIHGDLFSKEVRSEFNLYDTGTHKNSLAQYCGLFVLEQDTFLISPREYGGLRLFDPKHGRSKTLLPVKNGHFTSRSSLLENGSPTIEFRFPKDKKGNTIGLLWKRSKEEVFFEKLDLIQQSIIRYQGKNADLEGTLILPPGKGPFNTVVLIHGSGPIYRTALLEAAYHFVMNGSGVFIYDKRGTGASSGIRKDDDFDLLAADAKATLERIRKHPKVGKIGFQGHSQAGYIIPLAVSIGAQPDFIIIVNGGSISPGQQSLYDKTNDLKRAGFTDEEVQEAIATLSLIHSYVINKLHDKTEVEKKYFNALTQPWFEYLDLPRMPAIPEWKNPPKELLDFHKELSFDPIAYQDRISCPTLILLGEKDQTVPALEVSKKWKNAMIPDIQVEVLEDLGHDMRIDTEYGRRFSSRFLSIELSWLNGI